MKINQITKIAKENLKKDGHHNNMLLIANKDKTNTVFALIFRNQDEKKIVRNTIRKVIELKKPDSYFTIMETWLREHRKRDLEKRIRNCNNNNKDITHIMKIGRKNVCSILCSEDNFFKTKLCGYMGKEISLRRPVSGGLVMYYECMKYS